MGARELDERGVTAREAEVFWALRDRPTNVELSERLFISRRTVESHVSSLLAKLGVNDRFGLSEMARAWYETAPPTMLPAALGLLVDPASFFGRDTELARLLEAWAATKSGCSLGRLVLGEAGIGKSRLVAELVERVRDDGGAVWYGACFADVGEPFHPLTDVLADRSVGTEWGTPSGVEIAVDDHGGQWSIDPVGAVTGAASRIVSELIGAVSGPTALVIEDLHWARESTRTAINELVRRAPAVPLLLIATSRDVAPDVDASLEVLLGGLSAAPGVEALRLKGLTPVAVERIIASRGEQADADDVAHETGGNPLLIRERLDVGRRSGPLRHMLDRRYGLARAADLEVLDLAAVIGDEFSVTLLASAAGRPVDEVIEALGRLDDAGLVVPLPGRPGTYQFVHALFRTATYERLPEHRRLHLHLRLAETISDHPSSIDALARHACAAAPLGDPIAAARLALRAGDRISSMHDPASAGVRFGWGLDALGTIDDPPDRLHLQLQVRHARTLALRHDPTAGPVLVAAARRARGLGELPLMVDAICAMVPTPGGASTPGRLNEVFIDLAEQALTRMGVTPSRDRVRITAALGVDLRLSTDQTRRAIELLDRAVADAEGLGDDIALGLALLSWRYRGVRPADVPEALDRARQMRAVGHRTGEVVLVAAGRHLAGWCHLLRGDVAAVPRELEACPSDGAPFVRLSGMGIEVAALALRGELARARRRLDELEVAAQAYGSTGVERIFAPLDVVVRFWECRTDELGPRIAALRAGLTAMIPGMDGFTAMIAACGGRQEEADAVLDRYVGPDADDCWQGDFLAPLALGHLCYAAIVGDRQDLAPQLIRWLEPMSGHLVGTTASILMSADGLRADLLRILGRLDEAIGVAQSAIDASRLRDTELLLGYELVVLADALRAAGRSGDSGGAAAEAEQLGRSTGARRIGMELRRRALR